MVKKILAVVAVAAFSQSALAEKAKIWSCVDNTTLTADQQCVAATIAQNNDNQAFFEQLANQSFETKRDAFATITHFPKQQLIEVKSLESKSAEILLASRR